MPVVLGVWSGTLLCLPHPDTHGTGCSPGTGCGGGPALSCPAPPHPISSPSPLPAEAEDIKVCPRCSAFIMKINDGSCNRMNCTVCGCLFCWLCLQEISDVHFLRSVQGCGAMGCAGGLGQRGCQELRGGHRSCPWAELGVL